MKTFWTKFISLLLIFSVLNVVNGKNYISETNISFLASHYGVNATKRAKALNALMNKIANSSIEEKLTQVNAFFNQSQWRSDEEVWGQKDYWATRLEFLGKGTGDCEDYVIAKYYTLRQLGVPTAKLYFTYVKALRYNQAHMVLAYYASKKSVPLILDNINPRILPATKRRDLAPVYSFNADSLFLANQSGLGKLVPSGNSRNKKWLNLKKRMQKEGL